MSYSIDTKEKAISLRKKGYSIKEIANMLHIAKSTSSLWLNPIKLNNKAIQRLEKKKIIGQYRTIETRRKQKEFKLHAAHEKAAFTISNIHPTKEVFKLLCSIFFWTEGGKHTDGYVYFINSDPRMIATFLQLLRSSFEIDENKLRALVHIHQYHNEKKVRKFWSEVTKVPLSKFSKSYLKLNSQKRIRDGYQGCIRIRYYDSRIALELRSIYNAFASSIGV